MGHKESRSLLASGESTFFSSPPRFSHSLAEEELYISETVINTCTHHTNPQKHKARAADAKFAPIKHFAIACMRRLAIKQIPGALHHYTFASQKRQKNAFPELKKNLLLN
jgi:hypothetical protein